MLFFFKLVIMPMFAHYVCPWLLFLFVKDNSSLFLLLCFFFLAWVACAPSSGGSTTRQQGLNRKILSTSTTFAENLSDSPIMSANTSSPTAPKKKGKAGTVRRCKVLSEKYRFLKLQYVGAIVADGGHFHLITFVAMPIFLNCLCRHDDLKS